MPLYPIGGGGAGPGTPPGQLIIPVSGGFALENNQISTWGQLGTFDERMDFNMGTSQGGASLSRLAGGYMFPFAVEFIGFEAWVRNNSGSAAGWGFVFGKQTKEDGTANRTNTVFLNEVTANAGVAPRNYADTDNNLVSLDWSGAPFSLAAGEIFWIGVDSPSQPASYYAEIMAGYLTANRV